MNAPFIDTLSAFDALCHRLVTAKTIALDTEFISERSYYPELCLVQICADGESALIDPLTIHDLTPLWRILAQPGHETLVHAARSELEFALRAVGAAPHQLRDVQLAAAFVGMEYPAGYATLNYRLLHQTISKSETRSNWRRRPLSAEQITYALNDVRWLASMWHLLRNQLERLNRFSWFEEEMSDFIRRIQTGVQEGRWTKIAGQASLSSRELCILKELSAWREEAARSRNIPPRKMLRDDLIVEIAKRGQTDPQKILAIRGLERSEYLPYAEPLAAAVQKGLAAAIVGHSAEAVCADDFDEEEGAASKVWDATEHTLEMPPHSSTQLTLVTQLLHTLVATLSQRHEIAANLVASTADLRSYALWHEIGLNAGISEVSCDTSERPRLAQGWRHQLLGDSLGRFLDGEMAFAVQHLHIKMIEMPREKTTIEDD
ncbi:MAG: HRDC domain-containing protein [Thermoguttaceae bacterium]|nr:HRDC domain-containing protein [Thermoguttaceae bacterium]